MPARPPVLPFHRWTNDSASGSLLLSMHRRADRAMSVISCLMATVADPRCRGAVGPTYQNQTPFGKFLPYIVWWKVCAVIAGADL